MNEEKEPLQPSWSYDATTRTYRYWAGDTEVTSTEYDHLDAVYTAWKRENPATNDNVPNIKPPPDSGWEYENGGRGREITQFCGNKYRPGDPRNKRFFRSQKDLIETCKREGYTVERTR